jgi:hypothetical protein
MSAALDAALKDCFAERSAIMIFAASSAGKIRRPAGEFRRHRFGPPIALEKALLAETVPPKFARRVFKLKRCCERR